MSSISSKNVARPKSIIVIGAGMAGLRFAECILDERCCCPSETISIVILEANKYIGGRIRHTKFQNHTVEMGANWISGLQETYDNPVWKLAQAVNLQGHLVDRAQEEASRVVMCQGNDDVHQAYFEAMDRFEAVIRKAIEFCKTNLTRQEDDLDVRSVLEQCGWPRHPSPIERQVEVNMLEVWGANNLETFSAKFNLQENANDVDLGHDEFFVEDERGFNCILTGMVDKLKNCNHVDIRLNERVQSVCYEPGNVSVTTTNGRQYTADAIVCTASLGVLKSNNKRSIEFIPEFPDWKQHALDQVQMFTFAKVYIQLEGSFWDDQPNQIIIVSSDQEDCHRYPLWMRYRNVAASSSSSSSSSPAPNNNNANLFMCFLGGPEAERVEALSDNEVANEIEAHLRQAFEGRGGDEHHHHGDKKNNNGGEKINFRPVKVAKTDWSFNDNFCGSYSMFPVHTFSESPIDDLGRGLPSSSPSRSTLYFAGEAYDDKFNGWVQGAYRSGERVAKQLLGLVHDGEL